VSPGATSSLVANDARERAQCAVYGRRIRKYLRHIRLQNHDVAAGHAGRVGIPPSATEIVLRKDIVGVEPSSPFSARLLHNAVVRDESLSER